MGCGAVCDIPFDDLVHLFELLAREEEAHSEADTKGCGMMVVLGCWKRMIVYGKIEERLSATDRD